jgi:3-deoxy-7-phosphoheptulonate synthase
MIVPLRKETPGNTLLPQAVQTHPYRLASIESRNETTHVELGFGVTVGGKKIVIMAGPCAVESPGQIDEVCQSIKTGGAHVLRGGAFKPRTSPYAFQGLEEEGLKLLFSARNKYRTPVVTEVMDIEHIGMVSEYADCLQIGARNIQNFALLKEVGKTKKPVLIKRGLASTIRNCLCQPNMCLPEETSR